MTQKISAAMCISRPGFEESLQSLLNTDPDEILLAVKNQELKDAVAEFDPDFVKIVNPENPWENYGKYDLFDEATGDWIVVLDDDDIALQDYRTHLNGVDENTGLVFGDQEFVKTDGTKIIRKNNQNFTKNNVVERACDYYAIRKDCWDAINESMDTDIIIHDPARIMYWTLRLGWDYEFIPEVVQRKFETEKIVQWGMYTPGWAKVFEALENDEGTESWLRTGYFSRLKYMLMRQLNEVVKRWT